MILTQKTHDRGASPAPDTLAFTNTLTWNEDGSPASVAEGAGPCPTSTCRGQTGLSARRCVLIAEPRET